MTTRTFRNLKIRNMVFEYVMVRSLTENSLHIQIYYFKLLPQFGDSHKVTTSPL